jgi:hypothetical protein
MSTRISHPRRRNNKRRSEDSGVIRSSPITGDAVVAKREDVYSCSVAIPRTPTNYVFQLKDETIVSLTTSSTVPTAGGYPFMLANLANVSSLLSMFDQYKILVIDFRMRPRTNVASGTIANISAPMYLVIDYDNASTPASVNVVSDYQSVAVVEGYQSCRRVFAPHVAVAAYASGAFTSYANTSSWIDVAYPAVEHYGIRYYSPTSTAADIISWDLDVRYYIEFRNVN